MKGISTIDKDLQEIIDGLYIKVDGMTRQVAEETAERLRATSPVGQSDDHYRDGWTVKEANGVTIVYNDKKPMLTHLLEYGHAVRPEPTRPGAKKRVAGREHIAPAREWAAAEVERRLREL